VLFYFSRQIASSILPWNPYFQEAVVNIFEKVFDNVINYQNKALCQLTSLLNNPLFRARKCGWEGEIFDCMNFFILKFYKCEFWSTNCLDMKLTGF